MTIDQEYLPTSQREDISAKIIEIKRAKDVLSESIHKAIYDQQEKYGKVISKIDIGFMDVTAVSDLPNRHYEVESIRVYIEL